MNFRKHAYFALIALRGQPLGTYYKRYLHDTLEGVPPDTSRRLLVRLLTHCRQSVPYYAGIMNGGKSTLEQHPEEYLRHMPILTKDIIRNRFDDLKCSDLAARRWFYNTSGGSTGEPVRFIQDWEYAAKSGAIKLLFSRLAGKEVGEPELMLWGSERDIIEGSESWKTRCVNRLSNTMIMNAYQMTPERIREFIGFMNSKRPRLIVAYVEILYELARLAKREGMKILPQAGVMTSAGTLHPFMREMIETVFQCRVYNRYGSREVGDVACERSGCDGLWVAPWGNYVEIVDKKGRPVPDGTEGEILVTSLTNFAMPLVRYRIGDRGVLCPPEANGGAAQGQVMKQVLGRTCDVFKTKNGTHVDSGFFMTLLYEKEWLRKYQVVQKTESRLVYRIVQSEPPQQAELDRIADTTRMVMGNDCEVSFEFLDDIPSTPSGKFRYTISELGDS